MGIIFREKGLGSLVIIVTTALVVVSVGVGILTLTQSGPSPNFKIENLSISPSEVGQGNSLNAEVKVANTGDKKGTHKVVLKVDGDTSKTTEVTLAPGENKTVSLDVTEDELGNHTLSVGSLSKSFEVVKPAEFELSNLSLSSSKVGPSDSVNASVDVSNVGDKSGEYNVEMKVNGTTENTQTVSLNGGKETTVTFILQKETKKSYSVEIGSLSDSFEVVAPAEFEVSNLTLNPDEITVEEFTNISVDVKNTGGIKGTYEGTLKINGNTLDTKQISVPPGETRQLSFEESFSSTDQVNNRIEIGGLSENIEIWEFKIKEFNTTDYISSGGEANPPQEVFSQGDTIYYYARWRQYTGTFKYWTVFSVLRPGEDPSGGMDILSQGRNTATYTDGITWNEIPTDSYTETGEYTLSFMLTQFDIDTGEQVGTRMDNTTFEVRRAL